jgi:hypothetical protein
LSRVRSTLPTSISLRPPARHRWSDRIRLLQSGLRCRQGRTPAGHRTKQTATTRSSQARLDVATINPPVLASR